MTSIPGTSQGWQRLPRERLEKALAFRDFMVGEARHIPDPNDIVTAVATRLRGAGVPLDRTTTIIRVLNAESQAIMRIWERDSGVRDMAIDYGERSNVGYNSSPMAEAHHTGEWVNLWLPDTPDDRFEIVPELKADGFVHYICAPVFLTNKMTNALTFATKSPSGFAEEDIAVLRMVFPAIAACQEILAMHRILREVMRMYVGAEPHRRILAGDVRRGEVVRIRSAILFADMRDFTELTADMSPEEATGLLNAYYDCLVPPIEKQGGEVLKFIGDGVLAIFRSETEGLEACAQAVAAAQMALARVAEQTETAIPFEVGIALHFGEVAYGNVGSGLRLDYTVIGRDVNLTSRLASFCGTAKRPLLVSEAFRKLVPQFEAASLGRHEFKGIADRQEVFELIDRTCS